MAVGNSTRKAGASSLNLALPHSPHRGDIKDAQKQVKIEHIHFKLLRDAIMSTINLITEVPGPKSRAIAARREAATPRGAAKASSIVITEAQGAALTDADGNTLLDFAGGIGVLAVGHCPPNVVNAIKDQAEKLIHLCAIVGTYEPYVEVAELMNEVTPGDFPKKTILLNSGAEAVETAVKIARSLHRARGDHRLRGRVSRAHQPDALDDEQIRLVQEGLRTVRAGNLPPALPQPLPPPRRDERR